MDRFHHFTPVAPKKPKKPKRDRKPDILARLRADFGDFVLSDENCEEVLREAGASYIERLSLATHAIKKQRIV
jgi:hypothetical protein